MRNHPFPTTPLLASRLEGGPGVIRAARPDDAAGLARVLPLAYPTASPEREQASDALLVGKFIESLNTSNARQAHLCLAVAEVPEGIAGAAVFRYGLHSNHPLQGPLYQDIAILDTLAVRPGHRNLGIGRALLRRVESEMLRAGSRVLAFQCPLPAARFYERCDYQVEREEISHVTFFPRQGQRVFTLFRDTEEPESRIGWRGLASPPNVRCTPYTHLDQESSAVMVRGLIPGDSQRMAGWPDVPGFVLVDGKLVRGDTVHQLLQVMEQIGVSLDRLRDVKAP